MGERHPRSQVLDCMRRINTGSVFLWCVVDFHNMKKTAASGHKSRAEIKGGETAKCIKETMSSTPA